MIENGLVRPNFLYYALVYLFSGMSAELNTLYLVSIILLSFMVTFKYIASKTIIYKLFDFKKTITNKQKWLYLLTLFLVLFLHPIITPLDFSDQKYYLGKAAINIWHNSTTIFTMPFVILLFFYSYLYLKYTKIKHLIYVFVLCVLNVLAKPSFMFAFIPVFSVLVLYKHKFSKETLYAYLALFFAGIIIIAQYYYIYNYNKSNVLFTSNDTMSVIIAPFKVLKLFTQHIFVDFLTSIAFPLFLYLFYLKTIKKKLLINYSWLLLIFAYIIAILFAEGVGRLGHGNFTWQLIMCNYLLFLVSTFYFITTIKFKKIKKQDFFLSIIWLAHLASGILYVIRLIDLKTYC